MKAVYSISLLCVITTAQAQFPGTVGTVGTTAMYKDSSAFTNWATGCLVTRGYKDIANVAGGYTSVGTDADGTKKAGINGVVSLGDAGSAILTFQSAITNEAGFDFAVFENSFDDTFLELAFVEVSSDGINYFRFPATSNTQTVTQVGSFDSLDATKLNNLAGKYRASYGTPFDLQELSGQAGLNINAITHVKIVDVVGTINVTYASHDKDGKPVNDPYPTAFASGGFDLDAVGVIHQLPVSVNELNALENFVHVFPNPVTDVVFVYSDAIKIKEIMLTDISGVVLKQTDQNQLQLSELSSGIYFLKITDQQGQYFVKKITKN